MTSSFNTKLPSSFQQSGHLDINGKFTNKWSENLYACLWNLISICIETSLYRRVVFSHKIFWMWNRYWWNLSKRMYDISKKCWENVCFLILVSRKILIVNLFCFGVLLFIRCVKIIKENYDDIYRIIDRKLSFSITY